MKESSAPGCDGKIRDNAAEYNRERSVGQRSKEILENFLSSSGCWRSREVGCSEDGSEVEEDLYRTSTKEGSDRQQVVMG